MYLVIIDKLGNYGYCSACCLSRVIPLACHCLHKISLKRVNEMRQLLTK